MTFEAHIHVLLQDLCRAEIKRPEQPHQGCSLLNPAHRGLPLLDTLERSGLAPGEIDAVMRTGGSAQIPRFTEMLERIFGSGKVVLSDVFSGVTAGLAIRTTVDERPGFIRTTPPPS